MMEGCPTMIVKFLAEAADSLVQRVAPKAKVAAGCPTEYYWTDCVYAHTSCAPDFIAKHYMVVNTACNVKWTGKYRCC